MAIKWIKRSFTNAEMGDFLSKRKPLGISSVGKATETKYLYNGDVILRRVYPNKRAEYIDHEKIDISKDLTQEELFLIVKTSEVLDLYFDKGVYYWNLKYKGSALKISKTDEVYALVK